MRHVDREAYLCFAGDCLREASRERDPSRRGLFILIATGWVKLAERANKGSTHGIERAERAPPCTESRV